MTTPAFHRVLELDDTERTAWIARFVDDPASRTVLYDLPFPALRAGEQPFTWLIDQFRRVKWTEGLPGRIRRPVVDLVVTEGGRHGVRNRPQLLGELLEVAGACELTEVVPPLRAWIRDGRYRDDWYDVPGGRKSVRLITWSLLIGWRQTEGLTDALIRDLERTDLACAQLCFAELGRLAPGEAIERIPSALTWPEPYWREVLRRFLTALGPRQAISPRYREHWRRCFAEMIWKKLSLVAEAAFEGLLRDAGIAYDRSGTFVRLYLESGISALEVNVAENLHPAFLSPDEGYHEAHKRGAVRADRQEPNPIKDAIKKQYERFRSRRRIRTADPLAAQKALAGDELALTRLVAVLTPVIQARVARGLLLRRSGTAAGRNVRQEVEDLTQEIFLVLFAEDGKVLRSWQPERGLTLVNFVGLVAERRTASILRSGRRSPWQEDPTLTQDLDRASPESGPEEIAASREELKLLLQRLTEELSPLGRHLFDLLFIHELTLAEVVAQTGMSPDAVYAWRSRLRRLACRLLGESDNAASRRTPSIGGET